jgi:hypothetical protein
MNCKPNDLALIVRNTTHSSCIEYMIGTPLKVTDLLFTDMLGYGPAWEYQGKYFRCPNCGSKFIGFLDADLWPLRGQPTDEEVHVTSEDFEKGPA